MCVCVCVRACECAGVRACECACVRVCVYMCVRVCVCARTCTRSFPCVITVVGSLGIISLG